MGYASVLASWPIFMLPSIWISVTYVVLGDMEYSQLDEVNYNVLNKIGEKVFTSSDGSLFIYKVQ